MSAESQPLLDVFLSYSSHDKQWADAACAFLESRRIRCWIAPRDISPGTEWGASIIHGIDACRIMVLIFSAHANGSAQVRREVERAISKGLIVLPFRVENVTPAGAMEYALGNTHWLDGFTPPVEKHLEVLAQSVESLLNRDHASSNTPSTRPLTSSHGAFSNSAKSAVNWIGYAWKAGVALLVVAGLCFAIIKRNSDAPHNTPTTERSTATSSQTDSIPIGDQYTQIVLNGIWNGSSGSIFSMDATLNIEGKTLSGKIVWRLLQAPTTRPDMLDKLNETGFEEINGTINNTELELAGIHVSDKSWLGRAVYHIHLNRKTGTFKILNNESEGVSGTGQGTFVFVK
jgi:hypothetical protein